MNRSELASGGFETYLERVRALTEEVLRPAEPRLEAEGAVPPEILSAMRELGLFAISIPQAFGGLGWSMEQQVRLTFAFTRASAVYRSRFSTTIGLCSQALLDFGTEAQKERYLPAMASGECTGAFALTEEAAGSDAGNVQTTALRDGEEYVINGRKRYITNAPVADVFLVMARTDPSTPGRRGVSALLVDADLPGIEIGAQPPMLGQAGSHVTEVAFHDCRVPGEQLVGGREGGGLEAALRGINHARTHVAATCVGQSDRLIEEATRYALSRSQFGQPVADFQSVENLLADSQAELEAARSLVLECARAFDRGPIPVAAIAAAKYFCSEAVCRIADRAVQVLGGAGFVGDHPVQRLYRDVRLFRLFEGTSQIQQRQIARALKRRYSKE